MDLLKASLGEVVAACYGGPWPLDLKPYNLWQLIIILERMAYQYGEFHRKEKRRKVRRKDPNNWASAIRKKIREEIEERLQKEEKQKEDTVRHLQNLLRSLGVDCGL